MKDGKKELGKYKKLLITESCDQIVTHDLFYKINKILSLQHFRRFTIQKIDDVLHSLFPEHLSDKRLMRYPE